jgi:hypothetical protein
VRLAIFQVNHEAHATGIVFVRGIVKSLFGGKSEMIHKVSRFRFRVSRGLLDTHNAKLETGFNNQKAPAAGLLR